MSQLRHFCRRKRLEHSRCSAQFAATRVWLGGDVDGKVEQLDLGEV